MQRQQCYLSRPDNGRQCYGLWQGKEILSRLEAKGELSETDKALHEMVTKGYSAVSESNLDPVVYGLRQSLRLPLFLRGLDRERGGQSCNENAFGIRKSGCPAPKLSAPDNKARNTT